MNPFKRLIGIIYKDNEWKDYIYSTLLEECKDEIEIVKKDGVYLKDGSIVIFLLAEKEKLCGRRFHEVFVEDVVERDFVCYEVYPAVVCYSGEVYRVTEWEDFYAGRRLRW